MNSNLGDSAIDLLAVGEYVEGIGETHRPFAIEGDIHGRQSSE